MSVLRKLLVVGAAALALQSASAQMFEPKDHKSSRHLAPRDQVIAVRAARMFDANSGRLVANPVLILRGDRIAEVGPNVAVPAGVKVIDLGDMTLMPGMIDMHVHVVTGGETGAARAYNALASAQADLYAGFTTIADMDSRGGFLTVDLRDMINAGQVQGPRMQVVGQSLNQRGSTYTHDPASGKFYGGRTDSKDVNGPWLARAAVREAKLHGVDWVKIYSTQDFVADKHLWKPDGSLWVFHSLSNEEAIAIVDEAHRLGLKVACHSYDGTPNDPCMVAGVDAPNHVIQLDDGGVRIMKEKKLTFVPTVDDLVYLDKEDLEATGGRTSRLRLLEQAVRRAHAAGVQIAFGSGATSPEHIPHGVQADQFAWYVKWGMTPAEALKTSYTGAAKLLNYDWDREIGTLDKGKFADMIAVPGDPLADVSVMERVAFVMKGGVVVRDDRGVAAASR